MQVNIEDLKHFDWWNSSDLDLGKAKVHVSDIEKGYCTNYEAKPWDVSYHNITNNLLGSFPIAMQIVTVDDHKQQKIHQKHRIVTITYDPKFPPIPPKESKVQQVQPLRTQRKRRSYGV